MEPDEFVEAVLRVVESIPAGRVMAYGQVAEYLGAGGPRQVGRVLSIHGAAVPWWRVVTASGRLPPGSEQRAREHLVAEGTPLRGDGVDMRRATWDGRPRGASGRHPYDPPDDWPEPAPIA